MSDPLELTPVQRLVLAFWALFAVLFRPDVARAVHMVRVTQGAQGLPPPPPSPTVPETWHASPPPTAEPATPSPPVKTAAAAVPSPAPAKAGAVGPVPPPAPSAPPPAPEPRPAAKAEAAAKPVPTPAPAPAVAVAVAAAKAPEPPRADPRTAALQLLSALQREGRLVDFLEEDLTGFPDASIGAAARTVHAGCKKAIESIFQLEPVLREPEGAQVTVAPGFDAAAVRLSGNVVGQAPFKGALRHHGWRAREVRLPPPPDGKDAAIVAPAEVEL